MKWRHAQQRAKAQGQTADGEHGEENPVDPERSLTKTPDDSKQIDVSSGDVPRKEGDVSLLSSDDDKPMDDVIGRTRQRGPDVVTYLRHREPDGR